MPIEKIKADDGTPDIPIIDFEKIPNYPGKNLFSPETIIMFAGMIVTYFALKNGWNLPMISEQVQQADGEIITKVNQYHQLILAVILAIMNGGTFSYAKGKNDERRAYYRVIDRAMAIKERSLAIRQLYMEIELSGKDPVESITEEEVEQRIKPTKDDGLI